MTIVPIFSVFLVLTFRALFLQLSGFDFVISEISRMVGEAKTVAGIANSTPLESLVSFTVAATPQSPL